MKSFIICVFFLTLVGSGLCARQRREEPAAAEAAAPPAAAEASVSSDASASSEEVADVDGLSFAILSEESKPAPDTDKVAKLKLVQKFLNQQKAAQTPPPGINIPV